MDSAEEQTDVFYQDSPNQRQSLRINCNQSDGLNGSDQCISCTTFNILAPIYKRLNSESCESEFREYWISRNERILDRLLCLKSSMICLQEVWVGNEELAGMFEKRLGDEGYATYKLPRTNNRGDGLLTAVNRKSFRVLNYRELLFNDYGDRVAQLLHVELVVPFSQSHAKDIKHDALVVNTHLMFPHNSSYCFPRLKQVYKILQYIESYQQMYQLQTVPIILCGDWNGSKRGHVYKFLRSQCFESSYDTAHHYTDSDVDCHKWVSHRNHRGNICGVDFIWLLNPYKHRKPLKISFIEALLGIIKNRLCEVSRDSTDPFGFLQNENCKGTCVDLSGFSQALTVLGLTGHPNGLDIEELHDLWLKLDTDGDGVIDFSQFESALDPSSLLQSGNENEALEAQTETPQNTSRSATIGFEVKHSVLFPTQVEDGIWPEDYSLSDHAQLTVEFAPVTMHCPQSLCHPAQTMS